MPQRCKEAGLLQHLILHDLQSDDPPALVIVDSQTDLINKLSHLALFDPDSGPLADRLLLITPRDIKYATLECAAWPNVRTGPHIERTDHN